MNDRYSRQILFDGIGRVGQERLLNSRVLIIGCGALGTAQAEMLSRAGIGNLRIADRDFVEASNLQRQTMFTESDAEQRLPKAVACANHINRINSDIQVEPVVADVNNSNVERLIKDSDIVLDGSDNFGTRYLINDACVKHEINWVYGAAVSSYGVTMTVRPGITPCLRCIFEEAPPAGSAPTCDTSGVIMPIIAIVASVQVAETLKLLTGNLDALHKSLMQFDVWKNEWRRIKVSEPAKDCKTCVRHDYEMLAAESEEFAAVLCGREAVQISSRGAGQIELDLLADRLSGLGLVKSNQYLVRFQTGHYELTVFRDGRAIIRGTSDIGVARSLYARYIGS